MQRKNNNSKKERPNGLKTWPNSCTKRYTRLTMASSRNDKITDLTTIKG